MNKLNIGITGANGYIGRHLTNHLASQGHHIYEMIRRKKSESRNNFIPYELGATNLRLNHLDVLIHCAYDFSASTYEQIEKTNINGSLTLFSQAKEAQIKKVIYISSTSSFDGAISNYGKAKYEIEKRGQKFNITTIRPGLVFSKHNGGIVKALETLAKKLPIIPIIGDGMQPFYPCHIEDLASLISRVIETEPSSAYPFVAASQKTIVFKDILKTFALLHQKNPYFISIPYSAVYAALRLSELLSVKIGLRSDSLKYIKYSNNNLNFDATKMLQVSFREFSTKTLQE